MLENLGADGGINTGIPEGNRIAIPSEIGPTIATRPIEADIVGDCERGVKEERFVGCRSTT
jgi:hypothetical protein